MLLYCVIIITLYQVVSEWELFKLFINFYIFVVLYFNCFDVNTIKTVTNR